MSDLAVVERPGMRPYRAKKAPDGQWFDNEDTDGRCGVFVLRTHDEDAAKAIAAALWERDVVDMSRAVVRKGWTRLVPWGGDGGHWEVSHFPRPGFVPFVSWEVE